MVLRGAAQISRRGRGRVRALPVAIAMLSVAALAVSGGRTVAAALPPLSVDAGVKVVHEFAFEDSEQDLLAQPDAIHKGRVVSNGLVPGDEILLQLLVTAFGQEGSALECVRGGDESLGVVAVLESG